MKKSDITGCSQRWQLCSSSKMTGSEYFYTELTGGKKCNCGNKVYCCSSVGIYLMKTDCLQQRNTLSYVCHIENVGLQVG